MAAYWREAQRRLCQMLVASSHQRLQGRCAMFTRHMFAGWRRAAGGRRHCSEAVSLACCRLFYASQHARLLCHCSGQPTRAASGMERRAVLLQPPRAHRLQVGWLPAALRLLTQACKLQLSWWPLVVAHNSHAPLTACCSGPTSPSAKRVTLRTLRDKYRRGEPISMVTAYDYPSAVHVSPAAPGSSL